MAKSKKRKIGVIDFETDPFLHGRVPAPFCCEFYSENIQEQFWGLDCADQLCDYLAQMDDRYVIYAHNGGKFDFHFMYKYIDNPALIIKNRITAATLFQHEIRDSFSILPVPLRDYDKLEFDYSLMEAEVREQHKAEILEYLHYDCLKLYELVAAFNERFGPRMTIGGAAMREIKKLHPFRKCGETHDNVFRPFYYGGRVQKFETGIIEGPIKLYDVNSMYPAVMKHFKHPINGAFVMDDRRPATFEAPYFLEFRGRQTNALPSVAENGELIFTKPEGVFRACSHELEVALEHGLVEIDEVINCYIATQYISMGDFVDKFFEEKTKAKAEGDKITELEAKLILNSGIGRCGINPRNFEEYYIHRDFGNDEDLTSEGYTRAADFEIIELWSKMAEYKDDQFEDVAIAASCTSAARSVLLRGLQASTSPLYCDTDSIFCRDFHGDVDTYKLGAWDLEKTAPKVAIGAKKLYAMYSDEALALFRGFKKSNTAFACSKCKLQFSNAQKHRDHQQGCKVKLSSKGGSLNLAEIVAIAKGEAVLYHNDAPTFSLRRSPTFVSRTFRAN